jgi:hypothetical protein
MVAYFDKYFELNATKFARPFVIFTLCYFFTFISQHTFYIITTQIKDSWLPKTWILPYEK